MKKFSPPPPEFSVSLWSMIFLYWTIIDVVPSASDPEKPHKKVPL